LTAVAGESAASYMEERKALRDAGGPGSMVPFVDAERCAVAFVMDVSRTNDGVMGGGRAGRLLRGKGEVAAAE
jgi:hypothetical protein